MTNVQRATLTTCKDVALAIFNNKELMGVGNDVYRVIGIYYESASQIHSKHVVVLVAGDYNVFYANMASFLEALRTVGSMQVNVNISYSYVDGEITDVGAPKCYSVIGLAEQWHKISYFGRAVKVDASTAFTDCVCIDHGLYIPNTRNDNVDALTARDVALSICARKSVMFGSGKKGEPVCRVTNVFFEDAELTEDSHVVLSVYGRVGVLAVRLRNAFGGSKLVNEYEEGALTYEMSINGCRVTLVTVNALNEPQCFSVVGLRKRLSMIMNDSNTNLIAGNPDYVAQFFNVTAAAAHVVFPLHIEENKVNTDTQKSDVNVNKPLQMPTTEYNVGRYHLGLLETTKSECRPMYQHYINVRPNAVGDVANSLLAAILKHMNMHSLPMYGDLSREFQDDLGVHGTTPIALVNGIVCWKKDVLDTGITFADEFERIAGGGIETRYILSVIHMHIDGRNLAVCISKRYTGKKTTPSYLLNVVELLESITAMPYDGDVLQLITKYLATA